MGRGLVNPRVAGAGGAEPTRKAGDKMNPRLPLLAATLLLGPAAAPPPSIDPDTAAWWRTTRFLSSDAMEGRDTGSPGYERAARYVADRFARAGLKPAGEGGSWFKRVSSPRLESTRPALRSA